MPLDVPLDAGDSYAFAASADGSVIVGEIDAPDASQSRAVVWRSGVLSDLEQLDGHSASRATAVGNDGAVIAGFQVVTTSPQLAAIPVRWTVAGVEALAHTSGSEALVTDVSGAGDTISRDGSVVVGNAMVNNRWEGFRWEGPDLELLDMQSALGVDSDGSTIVGVAAGTASVWDRTHGIRTLSSVVNASGADLSKWSLDSAEAVSADGRVIVGKGYCGLSYRGFLVRLPADSELAGTDAGPGADAGPDATTP